MSPPINDGKGADSSDDESFVSASAISPVLSKPPPPAFPPKRTTATAKPVPKLKPELGHKPIATPAAKRKVSDTIRNAAGPSTRSTSGIGTQLAPPAGPNARVATGQPSVALSPASILLPPASPALAASPTIARSLGMAASPVVTRTTSEASPALSRTTSERTLSGARPPAVKPKPTIRLGPVSKSHFANNPEDINKIPDPTKAAVASERYVPSTTPQRTESKRFITPAPGGRSNDNVISQRLGPNSTGGSQRLSNSVSTQPIPITRPGRPSSQGRGPDSLETAGMGAYIHQPHASIGMSVDNLANAMVAGALASRSASRDKRSESTSSRRPPPPSPARRSGTSLFDKLTPHHSRHGSRAGSPSKDGNGVGRRVMKMTLRKDKTGSDEEEDGRHGRHRKRNLVKKHPNKHHEGDRKRWRDVVTERERKRYEGLWASNKGICIGEPVRKHAKWVNPYESTLSLAGSYATNFPGSYVGGAEGAIPGSSASMAGSYQAPGLRVSPYQNPTLSHSQNQSLGMGQPYSNSMQNLSTQSLATTSGSNSGHSPSPQRPSRYIVPPTRTISSPPPSDCVSSLVVRDIWSSSRLPPDVLREVWDLVDRSGKGMLCKDEFCIGLWLCDQKLKGRKLPAKVSDSVWRSLSGLQGVKIKEFKGRDKVHPRAVSGGR